MVVDVAVEDVVLSCVVIVGEYEESFVVCGGGQFGYGGLSVGCDGFFECFGVEICGHFSPGFSTQLFFVLRL